MSLFVILFVNAVIFASVLVVIITVALYAGGDSPSVIRGLPFKDAISGTYYPKSASLSWISSHTFIQESQSQLKEVEVNNGTETVCTKFGERLKAKINHIV